MCVVALRHHWRPGCLLQQTVDGAYTLEPICPVGCDSVWGGVRKGKAGCLCLHLGNDLPWGESTLAGVRMMRRGQSGQGRLPLPALGYNLPPVRGSCWGLNQGGAGARQAAAAALWLVWFPGADGFLHFAPTSPLWPENGRYEQGGLPRPKSQYLAT